MEPNCEWCGHYNSDEAACGCCYEEEQRIPRQDFEACPLSWGHIHNPQPYIPDPWLTPPPTPTWYTHDVVKRLHNQA